MQAPVPSTGTSPQGLQGVLGPVQLPAGGMEDGFMGTQNIWAGAAEVQSPLQHPHPKHCQAPSCPIPTTASPLPPTASPRLPKLHLRLLPSGSRKSNDAIRAH